eukprot:1433032-Pyramimonas_sp.AAC.1
MSTGRTTLTICEVPAGSGEKRKSGKKRKSGSVRAQGIGRQKRKSESVRAQGIGREKRKSESVRAQGIGRIGNAAQRSATTGTPIHTFWSGHSSPPLISQITRHPISDCSEPLCLPPVALDETKPASKGMPAGTFSSLARCTPAPLLLGA